MSQLICYSPNSSYSNISLWRPFWYNHFPSKVDWLFTSVACSLPLWSLIFSCLHNFLRIVGMGYPWDIHIIVKPPLKNKINTAIYLTSILSCYGVPSIGFNLMTHFKLRCFLGMPSCSYIIQYSQNKTTLRKMKFTLDPKNWHQKLKIVIFWQPSIKRS